MAQSAFRSRGLEGFGIHTNNCSGDQGQDTWGFGCGHGEAESWHRASTVATVTISATAAVAAAKAAAEISNCAKQQRGQEQEGLAIWLK